MCGFHWFPLRPGFQGLSTWQEMFFGRGCCSRSSCDTHFGTSLTHFAIFRLGWGVGVANNVQCLLSSGAMLCYWFLLLHWLSEVMLRYWPLLRHLPLRHLPQGVNAKSLKSTRRCYFIPLKEHNWIYHLITINQQGFQRLTTQPWPAGLEGRSAPNRQHGDLLPVVWTFPV